jgi:Cys-tRNA(Pro)/Cys-tRNA(Cys) deacylase
VADPTMMPEKTPLERCIADGTVNAELVEPGVPTPTVSAAAAALGVAESHILKSLLFVAPDESVVLAVACGASRVDSDRLASVHGHRRLRLAPPEVVLSRTGYPAGGTPPVCHTTPIDVVVDSAVMEVETAFAGGGRINALLRIEPGEIVRVARAAVADITSSAK